MQKDKNYYINQGMQSLADTVTHCQLPLVVYCKMTFAKAEGSLDIWIRKSLVEMQNHFEMVLKITLLLI